MRHYIKLISICTLLSISSLIKAQSISNIKGDKSIDYSSYIASVGQHNLAYSAEKFNVNLAEANILSAGIFPDPELKFGWSDNGQRRMKLGYGFSSELAWTLELGKKRKSRLDLAHNEAQLTKLLLDNYFKNLRADATIAYLQAIQKGFLFRVQSDSYVQMKKIAAADSIRFKLGAISQLDARQSKLEAGNLLNEVYAAEADWKLTRAQLTLLSAEVHDDLLLKPEENLLGFDRDFSLQELIIEAQNKRLDLKVALQSKTISQSNLKLAKANRALDLGLTLGMEYNSYVSNIIAPTPSMSKVAAGVSIPLKFSNNRPGELRTAQYEILQAEQNFKQTELAIKTEVTQAYFSYQGAQKQVAQFDKGLLSEAKIILDGKIYSYKRGETSLLEVLNAQRTYNDVQQNYYESLYALASALVELERAAGIWDIQF